MHEVASFLLRRSPVLLRGGQAAVYGAVKKEKKWVLWGFFFEGLVAKFRRTRQCDGLSEPDIRPPDLEFSGTPATEIAHFRLI